MKRKRGIGSVIVLIALLGLLFALNPDMDDFASYYQKRVAASTAKSTGGGTIGKALSSAAGGLASFSAKNLFERQNLFLASTYTLSSRNTAQEQYLGIAKIFIPIKTAK
jgi:hypothetical protein